MKESWSSYYLLVVAGAVSLTLPLSLYALAKWFRSRRGASAPSGRLPAPSSQSLVGGGERRSFNPRFLLSLNIGVSLLLLATSLLPVAGGFQFVMAEGTKQEVFQDLVLLLIFTLFLSLGLLYASRKGDFDWLK